jgi:hypothetical protein
MKMKKRFRFHASLSALDAGQQVIAAFGTARFVNNWKR